MNIQGESGGPSYDRYSTILDEQMKLKNEVSRLKAELVVLQQLLTQMLTTTGVVSGVAVLHYTCSIVNHCKTQGGRSNKL